MPFQAPPGSSGVPKGDKEIRRHCDSPEAEQSGEDVLHQTSFSPGVEVVVGTTCIYVTFAPMLFAKASTTSAPKAKSTPPVPSATPPQHDCVAKRRECHSHIGLILSYTASIHSSCEEPPPLLRGQMTVTWLHLLLLALQCIALPFLQT